MLSAVTGFGVSWATAWRHEEETMEPPNQTENLKRLTEAVPVFKRPSVMCFDLSLQFGLT
ncbi:hypothetical protein Plo01_53020 [Planobispora longispora]|uniref:Uncharacterized protein n=1 Tax=Planobispora longispora TaxID=28887 RepID=A0A8J3W7Q7_9ACTN|nr:hypothetical protein GCM10020093_049470 [Planobispora longispora]GIH78873.1 hypothetical protein Plo01_53020 [Planobispora longispora]